MNIIHSQKKLQTLTIPINGVNLIEASAGTGKTFTIVLLYLRCLLGIHKNKKNIKKIALNEILVVTFTNTAKEELYLRIKKSIKILYDSCAKKKVKTLVLQHYLKKLII